jgi:hypothetical protein
MFLSRRSGGGVPRNGLLSSLGTAICFRLLLSSLIHFFLHQVFIWDDGTKISYCISSILSDLYLSLPELDCGPLTDDSKKALLFKKETDATLDYTLGEKPFDGHPPLMAPVMSAFSIVAEKVIAGATIQARHRILSELKSYVDGACILPFYRNNGKKDFLTVRRLSGATRS